MPTSDLDEDDEIETFAFFPKERWRIRTKVISVDRGPCKGQMRLFDPDTFEPFPDA